MMVDHFFKGFIRGIQVAVYAAQVQLQPLTVSAMIKKHECLKDADRRSLSTDLTFKLYTNYAYMSRQP